MHWCVSARIGSVTIVKKKIDANDCQYKLKYWQKRFGKEEVDFVITITVLLHRIEQQRHVRQWGAEKSLMER